MTSATSPRPAVPLHIKRTLPGFRLLFYYAALVALASALIAFVPGFQDALVAPILQSPDTQAHVQELIEGRRSAGAIGPPSPWPGAAGRSALALIAILWALAMSAPVVWVLMRTRRLRYDPSLVNTLIVLPIVVAGVVLIVKNSLALAFALAGIVAGVRFRKSLEEPEEAVYVLLALGIGLAAGVQALDIALVMSMAFNFVVLTIWRYDVGDIYAQGRGAQLAMGDASLLTSSGRRAARAAMEKDAAQDDGMKADGSLVIKSRDADGGRQALEMVVTRFASEWLICDAVDESNGVTRLQALVRMKSKVEPGEMVADLETRWSEQVAAAEFIPANTANGGNTK